MAGAAMGHCGLWLVPLALLVMRSATASHALEIPLASSCRTCEVCAIDGTAPKAATGATQHRSLLTRHQGGKKAMVATAPGVLHWYGKLDEQTVHGGADDSEATPELPHCPLCRGCTHKVVSQVAPDVDSDPNSAAFLMEAGSGDEKQLVTATVWCPPQLDHVITCTANGTNYAAMAVGARLSAAIINSDCGFGSIVPRVWAEVATFVLPETGLTYTGAVLMREPVRGRSVAEVQLLKAEKQQAVLSNVEDEDVVLGALHDALLPSHGRHPGRAVLVGSPEGEEPLRLQLLGDDGLALLQEWAPNSFFLPNTERHQDMLFGNAYVKSFGRKHRELLAEPTPLLSFDYRCHTPIRSGYFGYIGRSFPKAVGACLNKMAAMHEDELLEYYRLPSAEAAGRLKKSAAALLKGGLEATLSDRHDRPCTNYYWHRPCCKWKIFPVTVHVKGKTGVMNQMQCAYRSWRPNTFEPKLPCDVSTGKVENPYPDSPLQLDFEAISQGVNVGFIPPAVVLPKSKHNEAVQAAIQQNDKLLPVQASMEMKSLSRIVFEQKQGNDYVASLPHVSTCGFCGRCLFDGIKYKGELVAPDLSDPDLPAWLKHPRVWHNSSEARSHLKHIDLRRTASTDCPVCRGCTHVFTPVAKADEDMLAEREPSKLMILPRSQFFQVGTPAAKKRIARVWCLPFLGFYDSRCDDHETDLHRRHLALARVRGECGFSDIVSPLWEEEVLTVLPGSGMVLSGKVLMMSAPSNDYVSLKKLSALGLSATLATLRRVSRSELRSAAIHDLLFGVGHRHTGAVQVSASKGKVLLTQSFDLVLGSDNVNSALLPGTELYQWNIYGRGFSTGRTTSPLTKNAILTFLDYRCHAGKKIVTSIGGRYLEEETTCLQRLSAQSAEGLMEEFGFEEEDVATRLRQRATKMLELGFEAALSEAANAGRACMMQGGVEPRTVDVNLWEPCCKWAVLRTGGAKCTQPRWNPMKKLRSTACYPPAKSVTQDSARLSGDYEESDDEAESGDGDQRDGVRVHGLSESSESPLIVSVRGEGDTDDISNEPSPADRLYGDDNRADYSDEGIGELKRKY